MRTFQDLMIRPGFSVIDISIVFCTTILVSALVLPFVISKVSESKFTETYESLLNTKLAFESYYAQFEPGVTPLPENGNFLPELVKYQILSGIPKLRGVSRAPELHWDFKTGKVNFDVAAATSESSSLVSIAKLLDSAADDGNLNTGEVQVTRLSGSTLMSVVLGLTPPLQIQEKEVTPVLPVIQAQMSTSALSAIPGKSTTSTTTPKPTLVPFSQSFANEAPINFVSPTPTGVPLTPQTSGPTAIGNAPLPSAPLRPLPVAPSTR